MKFLAILLVCCGLTQAEQIPAAEFRALQGDRQTIDRLMQVIAKQQKSPVEVADAIDGLVNRSKLKQALIVTKKLKSGKDRSFEKVRGKLLDSSTKKRIKLGSFLKVHPSYFSGQKSVWLKVDYLSREKVGEESYLKRSFIGPALIKGENWRVLASWHEGAQSHLLVALFTYPEMLEEKASPAAEARVKTKTRLMEVSRKDLARFERSSSATRQKAIKWLLGQGKLMEETTLEVASGHQAIYAKGINEEGWTLKIDAAVASNFRDFDFSIEGAWKEAGHFSYEYQQEGELRGNQAILVRPLQAPTTNERIVVMVVSPRLISSAEK